jgi:hypothetical protein
MLSSVGNLLKSDARRLLFTAIVAMVLPITACQKQGSETASPSPTAFASPEAAGQALSDATKSKDENEIGRIFGPGSKDLISTGDPVQDQNALKNFSQAYEVMHRWRKLDDSSELLLVGAHNQPFAVPLVKNASGQWVFDVAAGKDELLSRRIGRDEITAIIACGAVVDAQEQYYSEKHGGFKEYAKQFISDPGQQNGLYWESPQGSPRSPLGPLIAYATAQGYKLQPNQHQPFNGYYFVMLDKQGPHAQSGAKNYIVDGKMTGGFAIAAYPAKYGDSGIMTFLVNQKGETFQKDLGKTTEEVASAMTEFNPDQSWQVVE